MFAEFVAVVPRPIFFLYFYVFAWSAKGVVVIATIRGWLFVFINGVEIRASWHGAFPLFGSNTHRLGTETQAPVQDLA